MNSERQRKLINYLYPTEDIRKFLCDDLYQEFNEKITHNLCISSKNLTNSVRRENYAKIKGEIINFFSENIIYKEKVNEILKADNFDKIIDDIILGYVFYLSHSLRKYNRIDVLFTKRAFVTHLYQL